MSLGRIAPNDNGEMEATCSVEDCPWVFATTVPGKAAKELFKHHEEKHS